MCLDFITLKKNTVVLACFTSCTATSTLQLIFCVKEKFFEQIISPHVRNQSISNDNTHMLNVLSFIIRDNHLLVLITSYISNTASMNDTNTCLTRLPEREGLLGL